MAYDWIRDTHPIWEANHEEWARRERLLRGGVEVIETDLEKFEWEKEDGDHLANRKRQAVYPGFGEVFARTMVGHVLMERPSASGEGAGLSLGGLGSIERGEGQTEPNPAELVFYNINGTGGDGQQFWQWVASVFQRAAATGLRWAMVEAPPWKGPDQPTDRDVQAGQRPYAVEFSPRSVTNWKIERGQLQWCVIRIRSDTRRLVGGAIEGSANEQGYYLLVRKEHQDLGSEFADGGWWKFDEDMERIPDDGGGHGTWDRTDGEIPMGLAIWEWEDSAVATGDEKDSDPALPLARSATTALDNLSVAYMNAKSAWRSNMWRAAGGPTILLNVHSDNWVIAREQWMSGASLVGVPGNKETGAVSVAHSAAAAVTADAFYRLLTDMTNEAERMMIQLATHTPDSSGRSKEAGFAETKAPRLTLLSENMESFLNTILRFFELRFGIAKPTAYVTMPREFDLAPVEAEIRDFFQTFRLTQLRSALLESEAIIRLAEKKSLVNDENRDEVRAELVESARAGATGAGQGRSLFDDIFRNGPEPEPEPTPAGGGA